MQTCRGSNGIGAGAGAASSRAKQQSSKVARATATNRETRAAGSSVKASVGQRTSTTCLRAWATREGRQEQGVDDMAAFCASRAGRRLMSGVDVVVWSWAKDSVRGSTEVPMG
jgi:hypothetical protein